MCSTTLLLGLQRLLCSDCSDSQIHALGTARTGHSGLRQKRLMVRRGNGAGWWKSQLHAPASLHLESSQSPRALFLALISGKFARHSHTPASFAAAASLLHASAHWT